MRRRVASYLLLAAATACNFPGYRATDELSASCNNVVQDGDETGIDCGGNCVPCPTCDDQQRNGSESDVDCGGSCPNRCATDQRCLEAADCSSLVCASVCQPATCDDGVRNGTESGLDCGGEACVDCANGQSCRSDSDCETGLCQQELCVSPDCNNGDHDNDETDVDCGGLDCAPCLDQRSCLIATDCASNVCDGGGCASASCDDQQLNQGESSIDCGGPACPACADGSVCVQSTDCESGLCQNGTCVTTCAGFALQFDGNSSVKVARPVQDDFTLEAWIKTTATAEDGERYWDGAGLFWADVPGDAEDFGATMLGSRIAFGVGKSSGGNVNLIGSVAVNSGTWTHVAITRLRSQARLQIVINGQVDGSVSDAAQAESLADSATLELGGNSKGGRGYVGLIDEVRVWDTVRPRSQITMDKNRRLAGNEPGLVGYWRFDDGTGLVTVDGGSQRNDGILQGSPQWLLSDAPICP